jgi:hypothetical protein
MDIVANTDEQIEARALELIEQQLANGWTESEAEIVVDHARGGYIEATIHDGPHQYGIRIMCEVSA